MATSIQKGILAAFVLAAFAGCATEEKGTGGGLGGATGATDAPGSSTTSNKGGTSGANKTTGTGKTTNSSKTTGTGGVDSTDDASGTGGVDDTDETTGTGGVSGSNKTTGKTTSTGKTTGTGGNTGSGTGGKTGVGGKTSGTGGTSAESVPTTLPPKEDFTETVGSATFDMVYIPGGTFTLGCEGGSCDTDTSPVENITVSDYLIMKTEVSRATWSALGLSEGTWYDCMAAACELTKKTGKAYRMMTEAEFEYAAKKHLDKLSQVDATEEWAFNSWETKYSCKAGDVDPLGPTPGQHTQKTRRDKATGDKITGRLIRSIDGIGPKCRLTISATTEYPPGYPASCNIKPPVLGGEPENSYRDPRWVTGDDAKWTTGSLAIGKFDLQTWDDGTAKMNGKDGQWFTSNNIAFVFVPSSGTAVKYPYIFLDENQGSVISDAGFMNGFVGRFQKTTASGTTKPSVSPKSGEELAAAAGDDYKMVDMVNVPESAKKQDPRLLDTASNCWFQNNQNAGGTHNYRKDVDADEFRFAVIDKGQVVMLANGKWWTINNTFLHIEHPDGYVAEYLYAVTDDGYFFHDSFMAYERADFRMFQKYDNATGEFPPTCISGSCSKELAKGAAEPFYATMEDGGSTFVPAPCPAGGCK